jgi:hypothetical protein
MNQEIINLADDLELNGNKRKAFITEMELVVTLIHKDDFDRFYVIADRVMQKYM